MTDTPITEQRRDPRYEIVHGRSVEVLVQRKSDKTDETIRGELRNLSSGGAQLLLPIYPKFSEEIGLRIHIPESNVEIDVTAEVCWIRPAEENQCLIGCSFATKVSESLLEHMAILGIINRRRDQRCVTSVLGTARWELGGDSFPVRITDYSKGGFCMTSGHPSTVGGAVTVELDAADDSVPPISGKVCWQDERDGEYVLGCSLKRAQDVELLRRFCGVSGEDGQTKWVSFRRKAEQTLYLSITWVFVFVGSTLLGIEAIESWRSTPLNIRLADAERNSVALALNSNTRSVTAGANHQMDHRETIQLDGNTDQSGSGLGHHAIQDTTPQKWNVVPHTIGDAAGIQQVGDVALSQPIDTIMESPPGANKKLFAPEPKARPKSTWPAANNVNSSVSVAHVEKSNDARVGQDDTSVMSFDESVSVGHVRRHVPTQIHVWRDNQDASVSIKTHVTNKRTGQVNDNDHNDAVNQAMLGPSVDITKAKEAFGVGDGLYLKSRYDKALSSFQVAVENDSRNALYYYLLAMTHYQLRHFDEAEKMARKAIRLEQEWPIENRGRRLSRYQGRPRLWVEKLRSKSRNVVND